MKSPSDSDATARHFGMFFVGGALTVFCGSMAYLAVALEPWPPDRPEGQRDLVTATGWIGDNPMTASLAAAAAFGVVLMAWAVFRGLRGNEGK